MGGIELFNIGGSNMMRRLVRPPEAILRDHGPQPYVVNINDVTMQNNNFRTALWTGTHLQLTLMCIPPGESIGLEVHPYTDQFLRLESGQGLVQMGPSRDHLPLRQTVFADSAVFVPAGVWHNMTNIGREPIRLYSIYAPPNHPYGTVHPTKAIAEREEGH
jgi:mannose-6-phosphate isomerase-like protein (cupin superfamily)